MKLHRQMARHGMSIAGMPPLEVKRGSDGELVIYDGVTRATRVAKYLPGNGWNPIVLSAHPRAYEECRDDLLKSIPAKTRVVRAFALDAARHLGIMRKYPSILALPDRWSTWRRRWTCRPARRSRGRRAAWTTEGTDDDRAPRLLGSQ
ncbi:MAG: hypothetical protein HUU22_12255 [Phycisphaerae bacterium]|nr:hypothetical protein [Phycisphaerae bacterium]